MKQLIIGLALTCTACTPTTVVSPETSLIPNENTTAGSTLFVNGLWYVDDGQTIKFIEGERYQENGVFVELGPEIDLKTVKTIDLEDRYICAAIWRSTQSFC